MTSLRPRFAAPLEKEHAVADLARAHAPCAPAQRPRALAAACALAASSLALSFVATACDGCGGAQHVAGADVFVDGDHVEIVRNGRVLVETQASDVGVRKTDATFDMQFGMFDIEDASPAYAFGSKLVARTPDEKTDVAAFDVDDATGTAIARGAVRAKGDAVEIEIDAQGANDSVVLKSACTFRHAIGLGAQTHDVDQHGQNVPLWVSEQGIGTTDDDALPAVWQLVGRRHTSYAPIPAFVADNAAAYVVDTSAFAQFDLCAATSQAASFEVWERALKLDVYAADTPAAAQAEMVDALGRPPLPPPWTFAPWNDAIFGSDNVRSIAAKLRANQIPSSVIWTEDWRGGSDAGGGLYRLDEDWGPDPVLYPDFAQMVKDVNALGFQQLVYFNTFVVTGADVFDDVTQRGLAIQATSDAPPSSIGPGNSFMFTGPDKNFSPTTLVDLTNPDAVAFVKKHFADAFALGVRGWMADFGEWLPVDHVALHNGADPHLAHNQYPLLWQQTNRDAQNEAHLLDDSVIFERSAHLHSQPLVQVIWAGDQRTDFERDDGLPTVLPIGIGLSAVGFPFFTHDVAGYQSATNAPVDEDLFFRWTELGAFSPIMRTHHGTDPTLNVNLFTNDATLAHWKRYADLHMSLYPYLRALAHTATSKGGAPLWNPLPLRFPGDDVWAVKDEVMLGPSLLVAPVVTANATTRTVRIPSTRVAPFPPAFTVANGGNAPAPITGPKDVVVDAARADIPVFLVAGGIVPTLANDVDTLVPAPGGSDLKGIDDVEGDRVVYVCLGAEGSFTEESGASYTLTGTGALPANEPVRTETVVGDGVVKGDGFTFTLAHQPSTRTTTVILQ